MFLANDPPASGADCGADGDLCPRVAACASNKPATLAQPNSSTMPTASFKQQ